MAVELTVAQAASIVGGEVAAGDGQAIIRRVMPVHAAARDAVNDSSFASVLFTDLIKAFELVSPQWIRAVLRARGAPRWLMKIVEVFIGRAELSLKSWGAL